MEKQPLASNKKNAQRLAAHIVFVDESGFLLIPPVRKTWGPRGHTPIIRYQQIRQRISVISGLSVSPKRKRLGLYYSFSTVPKKLFIDINYIDNLKKLLALRFTGFR